MLFQTLGEATAIAQLLRRQLVHAETKAHGQDTAKDVTWEDMLVGIISRSWIP